MPQEKDEEIILSVAIDEAGSEKKLADLTKRKLELKAARDAVTKAFKEGKLVEAEYAAQLSKLTLEERAVSKEIADETKTLENATKVRQAAKDSIEQMRANLSLATETWDAMSKAERENSEVGVALQKKIKSLSDELKDLEESTGRNYRSVGDYLKLLRVGGKSVGDFQDAFKQGTQGVQVFTKGILTTRGALTALIAVPAIAVLYGLYLIVTKTQGGMDKLAQVVKAGELAFNAFTEGLIKSTRIVLDAFTSWEKFKNLFPDLIQNTKNTTKAMGEAVRAGQKIAEVNAQIEESEIALSVTRAKNRAEIEKLKKLGDDITKSDAVRYAALNKAYALENSDLKQSISLQEKRLANAKLEFENSLKTREDKKKVAEEEIKLADLEQESAERTTELQNNLNQLRLEGITKAREAQALANEEAIAEVERAISMAKRKNEDTLAMDMELVRRRAKAEKDALLTENITASQVKKQRQLIEEKAEADLYALRVNRAVEVAARLDSIKQSEIKTLLARVKEGSQAELELNKALIRAEADQQKNQLRATITNQEELATKIKQIDAETKKSLLSADKAFLVKQVELQQQRAEIQSKVAQDLLDRFNRDQTKRVTNEQNYAAIRLANAKAGSREEHKALLAAIDADEKAQIASANGVQSEIQRIQAEANRKRKDENERFGKEEAQRIIGIVSASASLINTLLEAQSAKLFEELDKQQAFMLKSAGTNADLREKIEDRYAKKRAEVEKEEAKRKQHYAEIEAIINGAVAITEAAPNVALQILAGATTLAQLAVIRAQKFADGGVAGYISRYMSDGLGAYIQGPGTGRSDSIPAHISNGESILNAKSTAMFYNQLSAMNVAGGGRPFPGADGSQLPQVGNFNMGGVMGMQNSREMAAMMEVALTNALAKQPPVLVTDDLHKVESNQSRVARRVTFS